MKHSIKIITAPTVEPVTVAEVKLHAHIDHDVEDTVLTTWIKTARGLAEDYQRRSFITQTIELTYDDYPDVPLLLPRAPVQSVTSIKIYDTDNVETSLTLNNFIIDLDSQPARIDLGYLKSWPTTMLRPIAGVKIRYVAGYGDAAMSVPANVKDAIMLYCTYRNENRAGEIEAPKQFYDLLRHDRIHLA